MDLDAALKARTASGACDARVRDLGLGGACIEIADASASSAFIEREAAVTIEVMAPTLWDPLLLSGRVAWVRRAGGGRPLRAGIRFEHRDPAALYALFQLLGAQVYDA